MTAPELPPLPADIVDQMNARRGGFNTLVGLRFVSVAYDEVVAELEIADHHHQPYGLVHGGVYTTLVETLASVGAALNVMPLGLHAVGLENSTSFLRAARGGRLRATATPLVRGRKSQVWEVTVRGDDGRAAATGRVRMMVLAGDAEVAGERVKVTAG